MKKKIIIALTILSAILAIIVDSTGPFVLYTFLKPLTTVFVLAITFIYGKKTESYYLRTTQIALMFCLAGDSFLLSPRLFVFGLASFLIGHICFIISFKKLKGFQWSIGILLSMIGISVGLFLYLKDGLGELLVPVIVYISVISVMAWQGISLYEKEKDAQTLLIAIGSMLFIASDAILAVNKFKFEHAVFPVLILLTYWSAIGCLAYATTKE